MELINRSRPHQIAAICFLVSITNLLPIIVTTPAMLRSQLSGLVRAAILANSIIHLVFLSLILLMFYRGKLWAMYLLLATLMSNIVYFVYLLLIGKSHTIMHYGYIWGFAILNLCALSLILSKHSKSYFQRRSMVNIRQFLCTLTSVCSVAPSISSTHIPPNPA